MRRPARPIYLFDGIEDEPALGGVPEYVSRLRAALAGRYGDRLVPVRSLAARLGVPPGAGWIERERIAAEKLAEADPGATFLLPNFHSPLPRRVGGPRVVNVVHDVQFEHLPDLFTAGQRADLRRMFGECRARADHVVFVSETSRRDFAAAFGAPRASSVVQPIIPAAPPGPGMAPSGGRYLLAVGSQVHHPHKNAAGLVRLFASLALADPALSLVVVGHGREAFLDGLPDEVPAAVRARIEHRGHVSRAALDGLFAGARAFLSLSRFEGFHMAAAEAASHGTPLLLSDLPVHRELFASEACLVDALAPDLVASARFVAGPRPAPGSRKAAPGSSPEAAATAFGAILDAGARAAGRRRPVALRGASPGAARRLIARAVVSGGLAAMPLVATSLAFAQTTVGAGGAGGCAKGGCGADGAPGSGDGGGGGSPATAGGNGGSLNGTSGGAGGTAGTNGAPNGGAGQQAGSSYYGGSGGGGGGASGNGTAGASTLNNAGTLTGGQGGAGARGKSGLSGSTYYVGGGGGGGAGGQGAIVTGTGASGNTGTLQGGGGGQGGAAAASFGATGNAGGGGQGGSGLQMDGAGTFTNGSGGLVAGGTGGSAGSSGGGTRDGIAGTGGYGIWAPNGGTIVNATGASIRGGDGISDSGASGGAAIAGAGLSVVNDGTITGGGFIGTLAPVAGTAIQFTGGVNRLTLRANSDIAGTVLAFSRADTFALGGTQAGTFDVSGIGTGLQYDGFGRFQKVDGGTWQLTGTNAALTPWQVLGGTLAIAADGALGAAAGTLTLDGGTLQSTATFGMTRPVVFGTANGTFLTDGGTTLTLSGAVTGAGGFTKAGTGTLVLAGSGTYAGPTIVSAGTLRAGAEGAFSPNSAFTVGSRLDLGGFSQAIGSLAGTGVVVNDGLAAATLAVGGDAGSTTFSGSLRDGGAPLSFAKAGTGALVLSGQSTYTGTTLVAGGTLQVDGSIASSRLTTVAAGGVLGGTGAVGSVLANRGGIVAPGNAANPYGTLTAAGPVGFAAGSTLAVNSIPTVASRLVTSATGTIATGGTLQVSPGPLVYATPVRLPILAAAGGLTGQFTSVSYTSAAIGLQPSVVYDGTTAYLQFGDTGGGPPSPDVQNSIASAQQLARERFGQFVTLRMLSSVLTGFHQQVNCGDCASTFASGGSFSVGAQGRYAFSDNVSVVGGVAFANYESGRVSVTSAPILAGLVRYDAVQLGSSRPFFDIGGVLAPNQNVHYDRRYGFGNTVGGGSGSSDTTSVSLFGRIGYVARLSPTDEVSAAVELARGWQSVGGYTESAFPVNPYPIATPGGQDRLNIAKIGGQWTHLFGSTVEGQVSLGFAQAFDTVSGLRATVNGNAVATPIGDYNWVEYGLRAGYRLGNGWILDAFVNGTLGAKPIGDTIHGGMGARYSF